MDESTRLTGEGFVLRRWRLNDLDALIRHANDERTSLYLSDRFPYPYTRADGRAFLSGNVVALDAPVFAIEVDGQPCGTIGARLGTGDRAHAASLGYWVGRDYWGRGLMTRVVGTFVPWVMREFPLRRLWAEVASGNPASAQVLLNNGFVEEGLLRSAVAKRDHFYDLRVFARISAQP